MKQKFLNKEEKTRLQNHLAVVTNLKDQLAYAALEKENAIREANKKYEMTLAQYEVENNKAQSNLEICISEFNGKYGKSQYMSQTGEIVKPETQPNQS